MRVVVVVLLALFAASSPVVAQILTTPPKGIILPNYDLVRIGQWEAIESGAVIATATGPLANVYNPAGLAASEKTGVNASSTGYQLTTLGLEGLGDKVSASKIANLGGFLGVVLADPVIKSRKWRIGFSIFSPLSWEPGTLSGAERDQVGVQVEGIDYRTQVRLRAHVPSLAAGITLSKTFRLGVGLQLPVVDLLQQQSTTTLILSPADAAQVTRDYAADGSTWNVRGTLGLQWDITPAIALGIMTTTPTARLWGSSFYQDVVTTSFGTGFETVEFRDPDARLEYKMPLMLAGGLAVTIGKVRIEGDVRWYDKVGEYDLYSSDSAGVAVRQDGTNPPETEAVELAPVTLSYRSVVNFSLGARIPLSRKIKLHAGFNSDQSPLANTGQIFRKVNMTGATVGLSLTGAKLSGSLGLGFQSGKSATTSIGIPPALRDTRITVNTFQLLYSITYSF